MELTEDDERILKQAIEETIFVPKNGELEGKVFSLAPYLPCNRLSFRSVLIFAFQRLHCEIFLRRFTQWLINICFSVTSPVYFKLLGMRIEEVVHFFSHFFTLYDKKFWEAEKQENRVKKYEEKSKKFAEFLSAYDMEEKICQKILNDHVGTVLKRPNERIQFYRFFLESQFDISGKNISFALIDMLQLQQSELFKSYLSKYNISKCLIIESYSNALTTACKIHDLEIVKYLIEVVGMNFRREGRNDSLLRKSPIFEAILISSDLEAKEKEIEREKSLRIVQYLFGRENQNGSELVDKYQPKAIFSFPNSDIVKIAYANANIPVLHYLKQLGFSMSKCKYLSDAVKSKDITAVKYYWNEFAQSPPSNVSTTLYSNFRSMESSYLNGILESLTFPTLEIFNTFGEFGVDITQYPEVLIAGRSDFLDRSLFRFAILENHEESDDPTVNEIFNRMLTLMIESKNLSTEYIFQLFSRFPKFKAYVDNHIGETIQFIQDDWVGRVENINIRIIYMICSLKDSFPHVQKPFVKLWSSQFSKLYNSFSCIDFCEPDLNYLS